VIARLYVGDALSNGLNDAGSFVAENRRRRNGPEAFDEVQVAVTDAACGGLHLDLAWTWLADGNLGDLERVFRFC
jgi:hypothetical protein